MLMHTPNSRQLQEQIMQSWNSGLHRIIANTEVEKQVSELIFLLS